MRIRQITSLAAVVVSECAALMALHRLGSSEAINWGRPMQWLAETPHEDVLVEVVRVAGLVLAWWLAATTFLYVLARLTRVPSLVRSVEWATLAPVRRVVDGVLATSMVAGSTFGGATIASAEPHAPSPSPVVVQLDRQGKSGEPASTPAYRPRPAGNGDSVGPEKQSKAVTSTTAPEAPTTAPGPNDVPPQPSTTSLPPRTEPVAPSSETSMTYVVQPGDNLWRIAHRQLGQATATGSPQGDIGVLKVRAYWASLVEINRHRLRSGDPDLIYPGEELLLPGQREPSG